MFIKNFSTPQNVVSPRSLHARATGKRAVVALLAFFALFAGALLGAPAAMLSSAASDVKSGTTVSTRGR